jgi:hypothetical protein
MFLLAYGAAHFRVETLAYEKAELAQIAADEGGKAHLERYDELIEAAQLRIARVEEFQMVGMPDDFQLSCSLDLLDEYVAKLVEVGPKLDPDAGLVGPQFWRVLLIALITDYWPAHFEDLPRYVPDDPDDDKVVQTALKTTAEWLVADDAHIVPDAEESTEYETPEGVRIAAARFDYYVDVVFGSFDLDQIDSSWFWSLLRPIQVSP